MSSYQQTRISRPTLFNVTTRAQLGGNQSVNLSDVLGPGACNLLQATLDELEGKGSTLAKELAEDKVFQWHCIDREAGRYSLAIGEGLPEGVQAMTVDLKLHGGLAEVTHQASYSTTQKKTTSDADAIPDSVRQQLRSTANRAVNRLFALTVATQVNQKMSVKLQQTNAVRVQNAISMRLRNENTIQTVARLRARG